LGESELLESAKKVLDGNWNGNFTIPSATLYPHQWSWDSCFIAMGNSYFETDRAMKELEHLFNAQWKNGMIPHIVFNEKEKTYFPGPEYYDVTRSPNAPKNVRTSGMTQPPVHALASYYIHFNSKAKSKTKQFLSRVYPNLLKFHRFLMTERDQEKSGLVTIFHPWESGRDDSPVWDDALARVNITKLSKFERLDIIAEGEAQERPSDEEYNKFIFLVDLMKLYNYDQKIIYEKFPFKIKDVLFSSILYVANHALLRIAELIGEEDIEEISEWISRTETNFRKFFSAPSNENSHISDGLFYDYDLVIHERIMKITISCLIPIYTGLLSNQEAESIVKWISSPDFVAEYDTIASADEKASFFKPVDYWRGPIWINTSWSIRYGLLRYGYTDRAERIKQGVLRLVAEHGFREYFDPTSGAGLGGKNFSWTAAAVIDMIMMESNPIDLILKQ
jgi:glycogen debranching enzyme